MQAIAPDPLAEHDMEAALLQHVDEDGREGIGADESAGADAAAGTDAAAGAGASAGADVDAAEDGSAKPSPGNLKTAGKRRAGAGKGKVK